MVAIELQHLVGGARPDATHHKKYHSRNLRILPAKVTERLHHRGVGTGQRQLR
jgi:hypothetical protein